MAELIAENQNTFAEEIVIEDSVLAHDVTTLKSCSASPHVHDFGEQGILSPYVTLFKAENACRTVNTRCLKTIYSFS